MSIYTNKNEKNIGPYSCKIRAFIFKKKNEKVLKLINRKIFKNSLI